MDATTENGNRSWNKRLPLATGDGIVAFEALLDQLPLEGAPVWGETGGPTQRDGGLLAGGKVCLTLRPKRVAVAAQHLCTSTHVWIGSLRLHRTDSQSPKATGS